MVYFYKKLKDFYDISTMISEDYVSKEAMGNVAWKSPLTSKHSKAIIATFVTALSLALVTDHDIYSIFSNEETEDPKPALFASETILDEDASKPLANIYATLDKKEGLENYDDSLEIDVADAEGNAIKDENGVVKTESQLASKETYSSKWLTETIHSGDTISSLFQDLNIPATTLANIINSNKEFSKKAQSLKIGDKLSFLVDGKGELTVFIKPISDKEQLRFYKVNNSGKFDCIREKLGSYIMDEDTSAQARALALSPTKKTPTITAKALEPTKAPITAQTPVVEEKVKTITSQDRGRLVVVTINKGESFSKAANRSGITYAEINHILQMFKGKIQFSRNIRAGDTMRVLFTESKGRGKICAVEFKLSRGGSIASYLNPEDGRFYDETGYNVSKTSFSRFPIRNRVRVTSQFNPSRRHPVTGRVRPHNGVDFGLPVGSLIYAPANGVVDKATFSRSAGYYIVVRHSNGLSTVYMHLSKLNVKAGQRIKQGAVIARSGNTGISTGPHLHYEIRVNNRPVNPLRINLDDRNYEVNKKARKAFANSVQRYKRELHQTNLIAKR